MIRPFFLLAALPLMVLSVASGATIRVPSEQPNIQTAVDVAGQDDTVLVEAGTYSGTGNQNIRIIGKSLVLKSESGAETTVLQATDIGRTIFVDTNEAQTVAVEGFAIDGGYDPGISDENSTYGGIFARSGTLFVRDCHISGCNAGALSVDYPAVCVISDCDLSYNRGLPDGGGVYAWGQSLRIENSRIYCNSARTGGGVFSMSDSTFLAGCYVGRNRALDDDSLNEVGAGLMLLGRNAEIDSCVFSQNSATNGGAVYTRAIEFSIRWSVFYNNVAMIYPGVFAETTPLMTVALDHNTFVCNYSTYEGADGIGFDMLEVVPSFGQPTNRERPVDGTLQALADPGITMTNNLFAFNSQAALFFDFEGFPISITNNNVWHTVSGTKYYGGGLDDLTGSDGNISADPLFCEMSDSGLTLDASSPCAGAGTGGSAIGARGVGCDMYAGEPPRKVTPPGTQYIDTLPMPDSLRDSLFAAIETARPWDTISLDHGYFNVGTSGFIVDKPLYIVGGSYWRPAIFTTVYDTSTAMDVRSFCVIDHMSVNPLFYGGFYTGIRIRSGSPIISWSLCRSYPDWTSPSDGINIRIDRSSPLIVDCDIAASLSAIPMTLSDSLDVIAPQVFWGDWMHTTFYQELPYEAGAPVLGTVRPYPWRVDTPTDVQSDYEPGLPDNYTLSQNYPNPFNPSTTIEFDLPQGADVSLVVYNILGRKVATLVDGKLGAGHHTIVWDGRTDGRSELATGVYLYKLTAGDFVEARKMVLVK